MIKSVSKLILKLLGWKLLGELPAAKKYIIIIGPHTSNWDFFLGILLRSALAANVKFLGKHQLFRFPFGGLFRAMGGMPVVRSKDNNLVDQVVAMYQNNQEFVIGLAPEGTRRPIERWRSGFYHIACKANIDIVMIGFDFKTREVRIRQPFTPTNDVDVDLPIILDYFRGIDGCHAKMIPHHQPKRNH